MDKNSIIGLVLIALIMFGFTFYQGKRQQKFNAEKAYRDSVELARKIASGEIDTTAAAAASLDSLNEEMIAAKAEQVQIYKDSLLDLSHGGEAEYITLENDNFVITFTTKGAKYLILWSPNNVLSIRVLNLNIYLPILGLGATDLGGNKPKSWHQQQSNRRREYENTVSMQLLPQKSPAPFLQHSSRLP